MLGFGLPQMRISYHESEYQIVAGNAGWPSQFRFAVHVIWSRVPDLWAFDGRSMTSMKRMLIISLCVCWGGLAGEKPGFPELPDSPAKLIQTLKISGDGFAVLGLRLGYVKESDLPFLVGLLDSKEPCAHVVSAGSSISVSGRSTVGHEAAYLIEGFWKRYYPTQLTSGQYKPDVEGIKLWYGMWSKREGRYLLRTNITTGRTAEELWRFYIQLTEVEATFKSLKDDLALRPIFHQLEHRIEAHIFISFLAYCLHVTLRRRLRDLAPGLTPRSVLEKFATVQMLDVHLPTTDERTVVLSRYTHPEKDVLLLLQGLKLHLPAQPPPKIVRPKPPGDAGSVVKT